MDMTNERSVQEHYTVGGLDRAIFGALDDAGKERSTLVVDDFAAVDEFHIRGREATEELARLAELDGTETALDIGSGLGGTARYLASEHGVRVTGIDLTPEYCAVANRLSAEVGLADRTTFECQNALELPFHAETFDVVWTEHAQMNIGDKARFYAEAARVLKPGGKLVFHDVFQGAGGPAFYPAPWAESADISFLTDADDVRTMLEELGLGVQHWIVSTQRSRDWFEAALERNRQSGPPAVGLHLLMGSTAKEKFQNVLRGLREDRLVTVQAVLRKAGG